MTLVKKEKKDTLYFVKVGVGSGLVAGFALFSSFLSIDQQLNIPNGTFYQTIGIPLGVDGMDAIIVGFLVHLSASALIGIAYNVAASRWRTFQIITAPKGMLTGAITGAIVFSVFFLPVHTIVMLPIVEQEFIIMDESQLNLEQLEALDRLLWQTNFVLWYSAFLHVLFGVVMGLMSGFILHERYKRVKRIKGFW